MMKGWALKEVKDNLKERKKVVQISNHDFFIANVDEVNKEEQIKP